MAVKISTFVNKLIRTEDKKRMLVWRQINNCPSIVDAAYDGYTGVKLKHFPTVKHNHTSFYPDITNDFDALKKDLLHEVIGLKRKAFGRLKVLKKFLDNFATGEKWDTKFIPEFPGRDKNGKVQYALYKNQIVPGNYLSNNIYGFMCAAIGLPESFAKFLGRIYSFGALEPLISGKFPNKNLRKFRDPVSDQIAISTGYRDFAEYCKKMQKLKIQ